MYSLRNLASLSIAFFLSLGIGIASIFSEYLHLACILFCACIVFALVRSMLISKLNFSPYSLRGFLNFIIYFAAFLLGYIVYLLSLPSYQAKHFSHFYKDSTKVIIHVKITEVLKPTSYYQQYIGEVKQIDQTASHGRILLRSPLKDSLDKFYPGQELLMYPQIQALAAPSNPFDIDFRNYYRSFNIFHRGTLSKNIKPIALTSKANKSWIWRSKTLQALDKTSLSTNSKQLIQAMVLGYREEWSVERRNRYSDAGVAHILAISGLHVGILYLALVWFTTPLQRIWKTKIPMYILCLSILWLYAWFTGMSPSVTRSTSMLSFYIITRIIDRPAPNLHILASSYLVLLLIKPEWLFQIGFQMSYTAVFFILWAFPYLKSIWLPKKALLRRGWHLLLITCIAQLGVMPWTLHYFGKIPGLFLLSNLILLSLISILLIGGMLIVVLALLEIYPVWIYSLYDYLSSQIDAFIEWVSLQDKFILWVSKPSLLISLGLFAILIHALPIIWRSSYLQVRNLGITSLLFICLLSYYKLKSYKEEVWLLVAFGDSVMMHTSPHQINLLTNNTEIQTTYLWNSIKNTYPNKKIYTQKFPSVFKIGQDIYLTIDSNYTYNTSLPKQSVVVVQKSNPKDMEQLINQLEPKLVIADASNYPAKIEQWRALCLKRKTPFLTTLDKGAILLNAKSIRK